MTRLQREEEIDETPQGGTTEEARRLSRGKRVVSRPAYVLQINYHKI